VMKVRENEAKQLLAGDFTKSWRYRIGLGLIIIGHGIMALGLLSPVLGGGASFTGTMILGGELVSLASIAFLGKEGFKAIKSKVFASVKAGYAARVGPTRHYIGIALMCTNVVTTVILMLYAWTGFDTTTPVNPMAVIWGLNFGQQAALVFWLFLIGELTFLIAIYVLGADWWGRFRALFVWKEPDRIETSGG